MTEKKKQSLHVSQVSIQILWRLHTIFPQISKRKYELIKVSVQYCYANIRSWHIEINSCWHCQLSAIKTLQKKRTKGDDRLKSVLPNG